MTIVDRLIRIAGRDRLGATLLRLVLRLVDEARRVRQAALEEQERLRARRRVRYRRRVTGGSYTRSARYRAGTRANRRHRTVPTFLSDRRPS